MRRLLLAGLLLLSGCYDSADYLTATPRPTGSWPQTRSGPWERFEASEIDLAGHSIVFSPTGSDEATYAWTVEERFVPPYEPGSGAVTTTPPLPDDGFAEHPFRLVREVELFGERFDGMFVSSNGCLTFGEGASSLSDRPDDHFALPGVALLRGDLNPAFGGRVVIDEWDGIVAVTYDAVPGYGETSPNSAQVVLRTDGSIELYYAMIPSDHAFLVGLSNGLPGATPPESDFVPGAVVGQERCDDSLDNDLDGLADCDDPDCASQCVPDHELYCSNGWDDDGDGLTDCGDADCFYEPACHEELVCDDGHDDDGDGFTDCADVDCWDDPVCRILECEGTWESFDAGEAEDLDGASLSFVFGDDALEWFAEPGGGRYQIEPGSGDATTALELGDDESAEYALAVMPGIVFFGRRYDRLFVSSNGHVTFGRGSSSNGYWPQNLFELPAVAALRGDLDPRRGGTIVVDELPDRVAVTWDAVPWFEGDRPNSAQLVLWRDGAADVYLPEIALGHGRYLVGVSNGCNREAWPPESDFIESE